MDKVEQNIAIKFCQWCKCWCQMMSPTINDLQDPEKIVYIVTTEVFNFFKPNQWARIIYQLSKQLIHWKIIEPLVASKCEHIMTKHDLIRYQMSQHLKLEYNKVNIVLLNCKMFSVRTNKNSIKVLKAVRNNTEISRGMCYYFMEQDNK